MKNILIAVDFSEFAQKVALHTAELAQLAQARLILFYAYNPTASADEEDILCNERWVQKNLDKLARSLHKKTKVSVTRFVKPGTLSEVTFEVADKVKADVVIICQNDASGTSSESSEPLLIAQSNYNLIPVLTLAFATNTMPQEIKAALANLITLPGYNPPPVLETF